MKTKDIQELYKIKLHSMDTILHQISLMDQVENEQELSEIIHSLLQAIGNYTGADRVYVFDWETDQKDSLSNTFEWCADGVIPEIDNLQAIPVSLMPSWMKRFENKETIVIHDLEATKCSEPEEYELLKTQEICSLIAVPIYANHQMNGFIGVDNPDLSQNEISITLLSDVGGHLGCVRENLKSTVLLKKALDEATKRSEIIAAIATLYVTIIHANVKERTYELLKGHDLAQKIFGQKGKIDDVMERLPTTFAAKEWREQYREFLNFDTLTERLRNTNFVSNEFMDINGEWRLSRFIVKSRDTQGNVVDVLYVPENGSGYGQSAPDGSACHSGTSDGTYENNTYNGNSYYNGTNQSGAYTNGYSDNQYQNSGYNTGFNASGYNNNYNSQNNCQMPPKQMDLSPLSTGEWLLTLIVGIIPCAGLILYIIWAFGNSGNLNRRNYCRASLILQVISYVLVIFFVIIAAIGRVSYYGY